jgi:histidinol-phosphate aminotransferase
MPFNASSLAQAAALAALEDHEHVRRSREMNAAERARVGSALSRMGITVTPSQANFLFMDVGRPARPVYEALLHKGVIVRAFAPLPTQLRVTLGTPAENDRFLVALAEVLA